MPLPPDYLSALEALGRVCELYRDRTGTAAVLVGGAAAAIYTAGQFPSGDFDVVAPVDEVFEAAMVEQGFRREDCPGHRLGGFYHPDCPIYGFQQVSRPLFDGRADAGRLLRVEVAPRSVVILPSIEDMIADRLGQHAAAPASDDSRLRQAKALFRLAENPDIEYLSRRIREEGGDPTLLGLPHA